MKTWSAAIFAVISLVVMGVLLAMAQGSFSKISDLPEFYAAARQVLSGHGSEVYLLDQQQAVQTSLFPARTAIVGFFVNPFALPLLVPIGWIPVEAIPFLWKGLLMVALAASLFLLQKSFQLDKRGTLWLIAVTFSSAAAYEALRIDQISTVLLFGLSLAIWATRNNRPVLAALGLSLLMLKPQELLPLLVFFWGARRLRIPIYLIILAALLAVISLLEIGGQGIINYKHLMDFTASNSMFLQTDLSPTLRGQLFRLLPASKASITLVCSGVYLATLVFIYWCGRRFSRSQKWLDAALLCSLPLGMVLSPYFFDYDLLILLPSLIVLMKEPLQDRIPPWALMLGMLGAFTFTIPIAAEIHYSYLMKGLAINPNFWTLLLFSMAVVVLAMRNPDVFQEQPQKPLDLSSGFAGGGGL
jgi:hypothetical protein